MSTLENTVNSLKKIREVRKIRGKSFRGMYGIHLATDAEINLLIKFGESKEFSIIRRIFDLSEAFAMRSVWEKVSRTKKLDDAFTTIDWLEGFGVILGLPFAALTEQARREKEKKKLGLKKK